MRALERAGAKASRGAVQRWIDASRVTVDGAAVRASQTVVAGARLVVRPEAPPPTRALPDASVELVVVYEDAHLLVVDKPAGLVVHPARGHATGTLVNGLLARGGFDLPDDDDARARPGVVHRLDKGTSGLIVVAKDEPTREALKALFAKHAIEREYAAIVIGDAKDATYDTLHGRHPTDRLRFTTRVDAGKRAVTTVRVVERFGVASLVACTLTTGRTHQIRVHLAERAKTPVLADPLYAKPPKDAGLREIAAELGRQALHARVLGFVHPATGKPVRWQSEPPEDFKRALARARASAPGRR